MRRDRSFNVTEQNQSDCMDRSEPVRLVSGSEKVSPSQRRRRSSHREGRRSMSRGDKQATKTAQAKGEEEDVLPKISTPNPAMRSCRRAGRRSSLHGQTVAWVPSTGYETPQGQRTRRNISSNQRKLTQSPRLSTTNSTTINASASVTPSAVDYSRGMISPAIEHQRRCRKSFRRSISYGDAEMASSSIICSDNHTTKRLAPRSKSGDENMMCASLQRRSIRRARSMEEEDMNGSSFLGNSSIRRGSRTSKSANSLLDM